MPTAAPAAKYAACTSRIAAGSSRRSRADHSVPVRSWPRASSSEARPPSIAAGPEASSSRSADMSRDYEPPSDADREGGGVAGPDVSGHRRDLVDATVV